MRHRKVRKQHGLKRFLLQQQAMDPQVLQGSLPNFSNHPGLGGRQRVLHLSAQRHPRLQRQFLINQHVRPPTRPAAGIKESSRASSFQE